MIHGGAWCVGYPVRTAAEVEHARSYVLKERVGTFFDCLQCPNSGEGVTNYNDSEGTAVTKSIKVMLKLNFED